MTLSDPKIERTARAIRRAIREATLAQRILVEDNPFISSYFGEEITMEVVPSPNMGATAKGPTKNRFLEGFYR